MALTSGSRVGTYEILAPLGAGGMGEVYRARDTRLGRDVAIKALPEEFAHDPERLARFEREARLLASLSHPNIAAIFGLEEAGGARYLVLEFVEGESLAARLARGALPVAEAMEVARHVAAGVEAAHESGVVHRDLKPANIMLTPSGDVKVLDFGLAKSKTTDGPGSDLKLSASPTLTYAATQAGIILGTAAYMSPEQARGKVVDKRSDIWSFGCVLYECLTGRRLIEGETVSDLIAQILERAPDLSTLPGSTPPRIRALIERCLEKDPKRRLRDIGEARLELEAAISGRALTSQPAATVTAGSAPATRPGRRLVAIAATLAVGAALGTATWILAHPSGRAGSNASRPVRLSLIPPAGLIVEGYDLSSDGRTIVALASEVASTPGAEPVSRIYVRALDRFEFAPIPGTEYCASYALSPDGKWIAFRTSTTREHPTRRLAKVPVDGSSPPIALCDWQNGWESYVWLPGGDLLIGANRSTQMLRVSVGGGAPSKPMPISTADGSSVGQLGLMSALPVGEGVLASRESWGSRGYHLDVWLLNAKTGQMKELVQNSSVAAYSPTGQLLFTRGDALNAVPFDPQSGTIKGEAVPLMSGLRTRSMWQSAGFALGGGNLLYTPGGITGGRRRLMLAGPTGDTTEFMPDRNAYERCPIASPDGKRAAVVIANPQGKYEIWLAERGTAGLRPGVAIENADCQRPVWSPDGSRLAFVRNGRDSADGVYAVRAGSGETPSLLLRTTSMDEGLTPQSWAPDGSWLLGRQSTAGHHRLLVLPMSSDTPRAPHPLRNSTANSYAGNVSPDGHLVAFVSDESGTPQVYVARLLAGGSTDSPVPVPSAAVNVSSEIRWSADNRRVLFEGGEELMVATVTSSPVLSASSAVGLLNFRQLSVHNSEWDLTPDGRLLFIRDGEDEGQIARRDLIVNWESELRAKMAKAEAGARR